MRSRTLVTVFAAAGTIADTNVQVSPERRQTTEPGIGRWTAPSLSARSSSGFHTPLARRAHLQIARRNSWRRRSRRNRVSKRQDDGDDTGDEEEDNTGDEEDEDEDDNTDDEDDDDNHVDDNDNDGDDTDDEDDEEKSKKSNAGAIAGGVIGGLVFIVVLFLLLFWFWLRPRRMRRRQRRRDEEEEEKRRKQRQDQELQNNQNYPNNDNIISYPQTQQQQPQAYQPIPTGPEPISGRGGVFAPFGGAINTKDAKTATTTTMTSAGSTSPPLPPQGTVASPAELASPVEVEVADGREPAPAQPYYGKLPLSLSSLSPSSPPPRYSTAFPSSGGMELPSPVGSIGAVADGREPSSLGTTLDFGTKGNNNVNRVQSAYAHPADQPNPDY